MLIKIQNDHLSASINSVGAELCSLFSPKKQLELIWEGKPEYWARHAPILFPIVGKLAKNQYLVGEKDFSMNQHGFARDTEFKVEKHLKDRVLLSLTNDNDLEKKYPFPFELLVEYSLENENLITSFKVWNRGNRPMPFSLGAHPAFRCPLEEGGSFEDYFLEFEKPETVERFFLEDGLLSSKHETLLEDDKILPLTYSLFEKDALILKGLKSRKIALKSNHFPAEIKLDFKDFPYFGIWTKPGAPFICLEPWHGLADSNLVPAPLDKKEGIVILEAKQSKIFHYTTEFKLPET